MPRFLHTAAWFVTLALLSSACSVSQPVRRPAPPSPPVEHRPTPTPTRPAPTATPTTRMEESSIGETGVLTPAPEWLPAPAGTPTPTATPAEAIAIPLPGDAALPKISAGTPPNVAAALRLVEDGREQMRQQRYDRALERFERAVAIDPTTPYGYYFLAQVHYLKKDYDQAIAFANRAAGLGARADKTFIGRVYSLQGTVYEEVGRYPDARKAYEKAIRSDPDNLAAQVGVARLNAGQ